MNISKLKKMKNKMPEKKGEDMSGMEDMESMDMAELGEEEPGQPEEDVVSEEMAMEESSAPSELEAVSDDDLMAEIKKRGLMSQLNGAEDMEEEYV